MTLKEAILKALDDIGKLTNYSTVCQHIISNKYYDFKDAKTPLATVSAILGDFIRNGDTRVKRVKESNGSFSYYLSKNSDNLDLENIIIPEQQEISKSGKKVSYDERDLHKLLSSYLKTTDIFSKTIFHEQSNKTDEHQKWIHPDMVGIKLLKLQTNASQTLLKAINRIDTFKISSYELKKEINTDYELKKSFFQAVSNSSWANYGYLVAFDINESLNDEMERLNKSFGIGIIELRANPFESKVLFQSKYRNLDFKTIDKLSKINKEFEKFIVQVEKLMTASEKYTASTEKELDEFCDDYFSNDTDIENYCKEKNIPKDNK